MRINAKKLFSMPDSKKSRGRVLISEKLLVAMVDAGRAITTAELRQGLSKLSGIKATPASIQNHISKMLKNGWIERLPIGAHYEPTDEGYAHVKELKKQGLV